MTIHLSGEREQMILSLLQAGKFPSADAVIDEALRLVGQRYEGRIDEASDRTAEQHENLKRLGRKLEAMPTAAVADGLSNRDHDRILYGK
jgi:Arc/MetJ-type ribon-helix-helix transcriptional regulator